MERQLSWVEQQLADVERQLCGVEQQLADVEWNVSVCLAPVLYLLHVLFSDLLSTSSLFLLLAIGSK